MPTADLVFFAIQAGVRLYGAGRKAYVDSVRSSAITLPLPEAPNGFTYNAAWSWFEDDPLGQKAKQEANSARLDWLLEQESPTEAEQEELRVLGATLWAEKDPKTAPAFATSYTGEELVSVLEVRQWAKSEVALPSPLQTIAGTLINIGVDYFAHTPGAISKKSASGRALLSFLEAIDDKDFAATALEDIAEDLMLAVLDSVAENPDLITSGGKEKNLVGNITKTLAASAKMHLSDAPTTEKWEASFWLQMVARSMLKGSSDTVLANPEMFLGLKESAEANIISEVGTAISELVIGPQAVTFRPLLTQDGLNTITKAALNAVSKNPQILKMGNEGLKNVLIALAGNLGKQNSQITGDMFPELARLVLEKSADNMDLIWGKKYKSPERHLLVTASKELLQVLSARPAAGQWSPTLTRNQVLGISEIVFDEVIDNPDWLLKKIGGTNSHLKLAVGAAMESLRKHGDSRLSAEAGVSALKASIRAIALNLPLLEKLPSGGVDQGKIALTAALDAIIGTVFSETTDANSRWRATRNSSVLTLVEIGLDELAKKGASQDRIEILRNEVGNVIAGKSTIDQFRKNLQENFG